MPPCLIIYGLTKNREEGIIERFLNYYIDRKSCEDRGDEELMMLPLETDFTPNKLDNYDWEPAKTLTHVIARGLDYPRRCFAVYLSAKDKSIDQVILKFTTDNKLILGLSVDDAGTKRENLESAKQLLNDLFQNYNCFKGLIVVEQAPFNTEREFDTLATLQYCIFSKMGNANS